MITAKNFVFICLVFLGFSVFANSNVKQMLDLNESKVLWVGEKVTGKHDGTIKVKEGYVEWEKSEPKKAEIVIDMSTIENIDLKSSPEYHKKLMDHLRNEDFFAIDKYPTAKLVANTFKKTKANEYLVKGDLTIKDQTHPVEFVAAIKSQDKKSMASGKLSIDRTLYGIKYGSGKFFENLGDKMIKDTFTLDFQISAK